AVGPLLARRGAPGAPQSRARLRRGRGLGPEPGAGRRGPQVGASLSAVRHNDRRPGLRLRTWKRELSSRSRRSSGCASRAGSSTPPQRATRTGEYRLGPPSRTSPTTGFARRAGRARATSPRTTASRSPHTVTAAPSREALAAWSQHLPAGIDAATLDLV